MEKRLFAKLPQCSGGGAAVPLRRPQAGCVIAGWGSLYGLLRERWTSFPVPYRRHAALQRALSLPGTDTSTTSSCCIAQAHDLRRTERHRQFSRLMRTEKGYEFGALLTKYDGRPFTVESL